MGASSEKDDSYVLYARSDWRCDGELQEIFLADGPHGAVYLSRDRVSDLIDRGRVSSIVRDMLGTIEGQVPVIPPEAPVPCSPFRTFQDLQMLPRIEDFLRS